MRKYTYAEACETLNITPRQLAYLLDLTGLDIEGKRERLSIAEVKELRAYLPPPSEEWVMDEVLKELHARRIALSLHPPLILHRRK